MAFLFSGASEKKPPSYTVRHMRRDNGHSLFGIRQARQTIRLGFSLFIEQASTRKTCQARQAKSRYDAGLAMYAPPTVIGFCGKPSRSFWQ